MNHCTKIKFNKFNLKRKKIITYGIVLLVSYVSAIAFKIYQYSFHYSEKKSDVAIILGAGTKDSIISPIFIERINHGLYLYQNKIVKTIIITGGYGVKQVYSDSELGKNYLIQKGVKKEDIFIEEVSTNTYENLIESKKIMKLNAMETALIVSDPLHMKRSISLAQNIGINCTASPTKTSAYRSKKTKLNSLANETYYYILGQFTGKN
jgi:uncharacterized SAM-binding protein YcdF (DUF218 family)